MIAIAKTYMSWEHSNISTEIDSLEQLSDMLTNFLIMLLLRSCWSNMLNNRMNWS